MIIKGDLDRMAEDIGHAGGGLKTMLDAMDVPSHARDLLLQLNSQRTKGFLAMLSLWCRTPSSELTRTFWLPAAST
ncbi:Hypermethylated in cancer 1 protein [Dissostichus eleginoides]|uniref:Hypermethylated in cancer 1 protein n=1 Tax=Dissostichus eleginoides TaxID=100907 RepID=A0AAD9CFW5_DISEL|nr:Hypermethylated in cancer 1 protein [Dissostichus eleginoides]